MLYIIIFLSFIIFGNSVLLEDQPTSNWVLEIKNEFGNNEPIIFKGGRYSIVTFVVTHESGKFYLDRSFDKSMFKIALNDSNFKTFEDYYIINPSKSLEYSTYIGLNCDNNIQNNEYILNFEIKAYYIAQSVLKIKPCKVVIDKSKSIITLEPVSLNLPQLGGSFFKLKEKLYNINNIYIVPRKEDKFVSYDTALYAKIDSFSLKTMNKYEYKDGYLIDFKFGTKSTLNKLGENRSLKFELEIYEKSEVKCFMVNENYTKVNFNVTDENTDKINKTVLETIKYYFQEVTPEFDYSNNFQIKTYIPASNVYILFYLYNKTYNEELLYYFFIPKAGEYIFKFDGVNNNFEYSLIGQINNLNLIKSDFFSFIYNYRFKNEPSKDINRIPQCAEFYFDLNSNEESLNEFEFLSKKYCYKIMNEDEPILSRINGTVICRNISSNNSNKKMICVEPNNQNNDKKFRNSVTNYKEKFNEFVENLKNESNIEDNLGIKGLKVLKVNRYYDNEPPDTNKLQLVIDKTKGLQKLSILRFNITSFNTNPIECYYNSKLSDDILDISKVKDKNIIFNGYNDTQSFEVELTNGKENMIYLLFMVCYNLPGVSIKYHSTGIFNPYTYIYSNKNLDLDIPIKNSLKINCNENKNKMNLFCLKNDMEPLLNELKIELPKIVKGHIISLLKFFPNLRLSPQMELLQIGKKNIEKVEDFLKDKKSMYNKRYLVDKTSILSAMLKSVDCLSLIDNPYLFENISINYRQCIEIKKNFSDKLIYVIDNYYKCNNIVEIIKDFLNVDTSIDKHEWYIIEFLFLFNGITLNFDSLKEKHLDTLFNITFCLKDKFEDYWEYSKNYFLINKTILYPTIKLIKKEMILLILKPLSNLINVLHFNEIGNSIYANDTNITNNSSKFIPTERGKILQNKIFEFTKYLNEFGSGTYKISYSMYINIITFDENNEIQITQNSLFEREDGSENVIYNLKGKGIYVIFNPRRILKENGGNSIQIINFDPPILPLINNHKNIIRDFISIAVFDKNGNKIDINNLKNDLKPIILYNKTFHQNLKHCIFYKDFEKDLNGERIDVNTDYTFKGEKFFACSYKHLTVSTAGEEIIGGSFWSDNFILLVSLFAVIAIIIITIIIVIIIFYKRKKNKSLEVEDINNENELGELMNK